MENIAVGFLYFVGAVVGFILFILIYVRLGRIVELLQRIGNDLSGGRSVGTSGSASEWDKDTWTCPSCGAESSNSTFKCEKCGRSLT